MIVPEARLLRWATVAVVPLAIAGAAPLGIAAPALGLLALGVAVALADAVRVRRRLDWIRVVLPSLVRLSRDRPGRIEVKILSDAGRGQEVRLGLPLPSWLGSAQDDLTVALPAGHPASLVHWGCSPRQRGRIELGSCYLETTSPWGLWALRRQQTARSEIRVYPNLRGERRGVAALFLNRGCLGIHARRQVGKGRDFEKLRDYIPGDGFEDIHWKATAKRGRPVTKVYQIERTQEVYVVLDSSRLSARVARLAPAAVAIAGAEAGAAATAAGVVTVLERCLTAALALGLVAQRQGDLFGLLTFSDRVHRFLRARSGRDHYNACRDALYALEPRTVTPAFEEVSSFIRLRLRRRALLVFLTALDDPVLAEQFVQSMDLIRRQHLVLVNLLPPAGVEPLFSGPEIRDQSDLYGRLGGHLRWQSLRELQAILHRRGVRLELLAQEELTVQLVSQYLSVKRTQRL